MNHLLPEPAEGSSWPGRCLPWQEVPAPPPSTQPAAPCRGRPPPRTAGKSRRQARPRQRPRPVPSLSKGQWCEDPVPRACAVPEAVHPWARSQTACHLLSLPRARSRDVGVRIGLRCRFLASVCHRSRNRSICLIPITSPSPAQYRVNPIPPYIYRITLRISPWLWFSTTRML